MIKKSNAAVRGLTAIFLAAAGMGVANAAPDQAAQTAPPKVSELTADTYSEVFIGKYPSYVIFDQLVEKLKDGYINPDLKDDKLVDDTFDGMAGYVAQEAVKADADALNARIKEFYRAGEAKELSPELKAQSDALNARFKDIKKSVLDAVKAPDAHGDRLIGELVGVIRAQNETAKQKEIADIKKQLERLKVQAAKVISSINRDRSLTPAEKAEQIATVQTRKEAIAADAQQALDYYTNKPAIDEAAVKDSFRLEYAVKKMLEQHPELQGKEKELVEAGLNGMLTGLDPHSSFFDEAGTKDFAERGQAAFGGIGLEIVQKPQGVVAGKPVNENTPAAKANIKKGDLIVKIGGKDATHMTVSEVADAIRGELGTKVTIELKREGVERPISVELTRERIKTPSVSQKVLTSENGKKVGYITMRDFEDQDIPGELEAAFEKLGEVDSYILNLENNPGGLIDMAITTSDDFLDSGEIVSEVARDPQSNQSWHATPGDLAKGKPVTVMINSGSASASEIVTGALKGNNRVTVVGTRSFGKGSVQTVAPFGNWTGNGYNMFIPNTRIHYTTGLYLTPNRVSIQGLGITPDIEARRPSSKPENDYHESDNKSMIANPNAPDVVVNDKPAESCTLRADFNGVAGLGDDYVIRYGDNDEKVEVNVPLLCAVANLTGRHSSVVEFRQWVAPATPAPAPKAP